MPLAACMCALAGVAGGDAPVSQSEITLEKMADPDWIGPAVKDAYWSADGRAAYYSVKRSASPIVDLHRVDFKDRTDQVVDPKAMADTDGPPIFDVAGRRAAFVRSGDIFVRDVATGSRTRCACING